MGSQPAAATDVDDTAAVGASRRREPELAGADEEVKGPGEKRIEPRAPRPAESIGGMKVDRIGPQHDKVRFGLQQPDLLARAMHQKRIAELQGEIAYIRAVRSACAPQSDSRQPELLPEVNLFQGLTDHARPGRNHGFDQADCIG